MNTNLLTEIEQYWTKRAPSYSDIVNYELTHSNEQNWLEVILEQLPAKNNLKILDIGTGPGFFAISLCKLGFNVTAIDYTQAMLDRAKKNAKELKSKIEWFRMDAHELAFDENTFDVIVTRNLTWNLEHPQKAYTEWFRVLKEKGILLNFDAGWYNYLYDTEKHTQFKQDRENATSTQVFDFESYEDSYRMEEISRKLPFSQCLRPHTDVAFLLNAGFSKISVDTEIWKRTWDDLEKVNFSSTPLFMLKACK